MASVICRRRDRADMQKRDPHTSDHSTAGNRTTDTRRRRGRPPAVLLSVTPGLQTWRLRILSHVTLPRNRTCGNHSNQPGRGRKAGRVIPQSAEPKMAAPGVLLCDWLKEAGASRGDSMEDLPEEVRGLLEKHPALELIPGNKVRFSVTGHELPCRLPDLRSFTEGKKYQRLASRPVHYSSYEPHIVPSTKNRHQLFCKLTLRHLNKVPEHVERHVQGKRFTRALHRYEDCQKRGVQFVPACLQSKKKHRPREDERAHGEEDVWAPKDGHSEHSDSGDSMSDLYPGHMFSKKTPAEAEDGRLQCASDEEMEVEETLCSNNKKRPQKQNGSSQKKFKSRHKKPKTSKKL